MKKNLLNALNPDADILASIVEHGALVHPYDDGLSSKRVVDAVESMIKKRNVAFKKEAF